MNPQELRIGNYVTFDFHENIGGNKVIEVFAKDLMNMEKEKSDEKLQPNTAKMRGTVD